jgi:hypothetical protein
MKLVKYFAGDFDHTCNPKECPAVIVSVSETEVTNKVTKKTKTIEVATLVIFQDNGELVERREKVPHADDRLVGGIDKTTGKESVHAYFEEYPAEKPAKSEVSRKEFDEVKSQLKGAIEIIKQLTVKGPDSPSAQG